MQTWWILTVLQSRKPIYDDVQSPTSGTTGARPAPSNPAPVQGSSRRDDVLTPTDRLAVQIQRARLFLHARVQAGEETLNSYMTSFLRLESSFTGTIASLAPPEQSGERVMPGAIYVLVAAMAGSIVSRNRNILLRATVPVAVGLGAGWVVLPLTMHNIGELVWRYEEKVPLIGNNHLRIQGAVEETWRMAKAHGQGALAFVDQKVKGGREAVEEWVREGR